MKAVLSVGRGLIYTMLIYTIKSNGDLVWFRHHGHGIGEDRSADPVVVDHGWHEFRHVFAFRVDE